MDLNDLAEFLDEFRAEAGEHLQALDAQLLKLEREPADPQPIREMFLSAHTIKGGAGMMQLGDIQVLAHALEDVLAYLRDERQLLDSETADLVFRALDTLRELNVTSEPGSVPDQATAELAAALRKRATHRAHAPKPAEPAAGATGEDGPAVAGSGGPRVLLVEDSATVRLLAKMLLADAGFHVDGTADGRQALALAVASPYQLVVTAIETRGLRGLDFAAKLRDLPGYGKVAIVVMSSDDNPEHRRRAADLGVAAYVRKGTLGAQRLVELAKELAPRR